MNVRAKDGRTPLIFACDVGDRDCAYALIDAGCDVHAKDIYGRNSLMLSAQWGRTELINALIAKGVDINLRNDDGHTALYLA